MTLHSDSDSDIDSDPKAALAWQDALVAAACIAVDPIGLGGVRVRAGAGPVRDAWLVRWRAWVVEGSPVRTVPLHVDDGRLFGGLDLAASLRAGRRLVEPGVLAQADGGFALLSMAERIDPSVAAAIAVRSESGDSRFGIVALDEGDDDEAVPATLDERLGLAVDLRRCSLRTLHAATASVAWTPAGIAAARARLPDVEVDGSSIEALCAAAAALGIGSMRMPLYAMRAARAIAALHGRPRAETDDIALAARLVFATRARRIAPTSAPDEPSVGDTTPADDADDSAIGDDRSGPSDEIDESCVAPDSLEEIVLEAAVAAMPPGLLQELARGVGSLRARPSRGSGAGATQRGGARGAPAGVRRGRPRAPERLSLIETLRAAAPWQRIRRAEAASGPSPSARVHVRLEDLHVVRFSTRHPTTTLFIVDASGSSALNRLAEAKGAVELLLADCYVRRDSVAVLAFRGKDAQLLLPPTRSLVRARRSLAGLPGGGGTPLAAAPDAARRLIVGLRRRGDTVLTVLLTDGRANVARDGSGGRPQAEADALQAARALRALQVDALLIDTSARPHAMAATLAAEMGALYRPLPNAGAAEMSTLVNRAASGRSSLRGA